MTGRIGIISYLPDNKPVRTDRYNMLLKQYDWISNLTCFADWKCYIVTQNYKDLSIPGRYVAYDFDIGMGPSKARNILLEDFYNSDDDWMLCVDDDVITTDKYESYQLFEDVLIKEKFKDVDMITGVFGRFQPYTYMNVDRDKIVKNWTFIPREINTPGNIILLRNLKKYYDKQIYYRDINLFKYEGREDMSFLVDCIMNGLKCYRCNQLVIRNLGEIKSCLFDYDTPTHNAQTKQCLEGFLKEHSGYIYRNVNGTVNYKDFNTRYNKAVPLLIIQRDVPIQNPQDDWFIVKHRTKKQPERRTLF